MEFSASEIRKLRKRLKLILENIGLDFIVHTLSILIKLTYKNYFDAILPRSGPITRAMARRLQED